MNRTLLCAAVFAAMLGTGGVLRADPVLDRATQLAAVAAGWEAFGAGDLDALEAFYAEAMIFVMPGQTDVLEGRAAFRAALEDIGAALPPGFAVTGLRYLAGEDEVVNIVEWTADKLPEGSQMAILFRFDEAGLINEERWFVDTVQWQAAF